jgi:hypothetical protein
MASIYQRENSPFWWIKWKDEGGSIRRESTFLEVQSVGQTREANTLKIQRTLEERRAPKHMGKLLSEWVPIWLYGTKKGKTLEKYIQIWAVIEAFLSERGVRVASQITRELCMEYNLRRQVGLSGLGKCCASTALFDLRILRAILFEAVKRGQVQVNVASRLGIKMPRAKERGELTSQDIDMIRLALPKGDHRMRIAFEFAIHQGCRLRETSMPMDRIDEKEGTITFVTKGDRLLVTALNPGLLPLIQRLRKAKATETFPWYQQISRDFSRLFKKLGLSAQGKTFHSTRVTAITRLARSGKVSEQQAMRFIGHSSSAVHKIYQRLGAGDLGSCLAALQDEKTLSSETQGSAPTTARRGKASSVSRTGTGSRKRSSR